MDNQPYQPFQMGPNGAQGSAGGPQPNPQPNSQPLFSSAQMPQAQQSQQSQQPQNGSWAAPNPMLTPNLAAPKGGSRLDKSTLFMVLSIVGGLVAVTFIALFIWMYSKWSTAHNDVESQVMSAVTTAVNEKAEELESQFVEREKSPYRTFAGPVDYGELSFEYPKTWSVYEAADASNGGDYEAYLNPDKVYPVGTNTINALRVTIKNQSYDNVTNQYESNLKNGKLTVSVRPINGENSNLYSGELPGGKLVGTAAVFRIRDKTVIMQTDAMLFMDDYQKILDSVRFNQ